MRAARGHPCQWLGLLLLGGACGQGAASRRSALSRERARVTTTVHDVLRVPVRSRRPTASSGPPSSGSRCAPQHGPGMERAVQCKFYEPDHTVQKNDLDSFFTARLPGLRRSRPPALRAAHRLRVRKALRRHRNLARQHPSGHPRRAVPSAQDEDPGGGVRVPARVALRQRVDRRPRNRGGYPFSAACADAGEARAVPRSHRATVWVPLTTPGSAPVKSLRRNRIHRTESLPYRYQSSPPLPRALRTYASRDGDTRFRPSVS